MPLVLSGYIDHNNIADESDPPAKVKEKEPTMTKYGDKKQHVKISAYVSTCTCVKPFTCI